MKKILLVLAAGSLALSSPPSPADDSLIRFNDPGLRGMSPQEFQATYGGQLDLVSGPGMVYRWQHEAADQGLLDRRLDFIQPNYEIGLLPNPSILENRDAFIKMYQTIPQMRRSAPSAKDPALQKPPVPLEGPDPYLNRCWGMFTIGATEAWLKAPTGEDIVVAVIDSGIDYNHPDLMGSLWRNPGEIEGDGIDNDKNGYIDDIIGWDFDDGDNTPYDVSNSLVDIFLRGGNAGHGTHVAGVIAAQRNNREGIAGVAPKAKIMALRFITEKGRGTTASAVKAIDYAVANKAKIINASWGGEKGDKDDNALLEAIQRAEKAGVLLVAAAGNGRSRLNGSEGYSNDTDPKPNYPASLPVSNIISVAALGEDGALGRFSNFGEKTVSIAAPGVKVFSTVPGARYRDTILDLGPIRKATWDGTSMAAPFVAGALAVLWSKNPALPAKDVRERLLSAAVPTDALKKKVATGGRLDMKALP